MYIAKRRGDGHWSGNPQCLAQCSSTLYSFWMVNLTFCEAREKTSFCKHKSWGIDFWSITEADTQHLAVELTVNTNRKVKNSGPKGRELRKRQRVRGEQCSSRAKVSMVSGGVGPRQENWIGTWSQRRMVSASHMVLSKMSEERYWSAVIWGGQESGFNLLSRSMHGTS